MSNTNYHMDLDIEGKGQIIVVHNGEMYSVDSGHPEFPLYFKAAHEGTPFEEVLNSLGGLTKIVQLSDRMSLTDGVLTFDGEVVDTALATAIKRYHAEGRDMTGLVNFMTKLYDATDSYRIRNFTWQWLEQQRLEVTVDGNILGYRGLQHDMHSKHDGGAYVDGTWVDGHVPNLPGTVISLPRAKVSDDPDVNCGPGLHVGSESYARSWGPRHIIVEVEPKDIVSVPKSSTNKMRVSRFRVIEEIKPDLPVPDHEAKATVVEEIDHILEEKGVDRGWRERLRNLAGRFSRR